MILKEKKFNNMICVNTHGVIIHSDVFELAKLN